jgi:hypothetical protein
MTKFKKEILTKIALFILIFSCLYTGVKIGTDVEQSKNTTVTCITNEDIIFLEGLDKVDFFSISKGNYKYSNNYELTLYIEDFSKEFESENFYDIIGEVKNWYQENKECFNN